MINRCIFLFIVLMLAASSSHSLDFLGHVLDRHDPAVQQACTAAMQSDSRCSGGTQCAISSTQIGYSITGSGACTAQINHGWWGGYFHQVTACHEEAEAVGSFCMCKTDPSVQWTGAGTCPEEQQCEPWSITPGCAKECPPLEYTYYIGDQQFYGSMGGGLVGHGQQCPEPPHPPGNQWYCIQEAGAFDECVRGPDSLHETQGMNRRTETETSTQNADGSISTNTSTQTESIQGGRYGQSSGETAGNFGGQQTGQTGLDDEGNTVSAEAGCTSGVCISDNQITWDDNQLQLCGHGGVVSGAAGCDYSPPSCSYGQVPTAYGCIDLPTYDPPETDQPPTQTTETTQSTNGDTTTRQTITTGISGTTGSVSGGSGSGGGGAAGEEASTDESNATGSASRNCDAPPRSTGDAQLHAILMQNWYAMCQGDEFEEPEFGDLTDEVDAAKTALTDGMDSIKSQISGAFTTLSTGGTSSCAPNSIAIRGVDIDFSFCRWYPYLEILGAVLLAIAAFWAIGIVLRD